MFFRDNILIFYIKTMVAINLDILKKNIDFKSDRECYHYIKNNSIKKRL